MELIDNNSVYQTIWSRFPFRGFSQSDGFISYWKKWALRILTVLEKKNVGVVAETGAGKTILAHLVATARYQKILFLVPEKILAHQHQSLLRAIAGEGMYTTQVVLGSTPPRKRRWENDAHIIFATPQTFVADFNRYKVNMDFDLVIFDEFHRGVGKYDYTKVAGLCYALQVRTLLLSASPGKNKQKIDAIAGLLHIDHFLFIPHPQQKKMKSTSVLWVDPDERIKKIEEVVHPLLQDITGKIKQWAPSFEVKSNMPQKQLGRIELFAKHLYPCKQKFELLFLLAAHRKLTYLLQAALTETYTVAHAYWLRLFTDASKSGQYLSSQRSLQKLFSEIILWDDMSHPKMKMLMKRIQSYASFERGIIFVNNKKAGVVIKDIVKKLSLRSEVLFGRTSIKKQQRLLEKIRTGEVDFLVATSVIEEGVSVPEIGCVINFSMPLTEQSRIQRMGRTGRTVPGNVEYIVLNHPLDKIPFFVTARGARTMRELISGVSVSAHTRIRRKKIPENLDLFFD